MGVALSVSDWFLVGSLICLFVLSFLPSFLSSFVWWLVFVVDTGCVSAVSIVPASLLKFEISTLQVENLLFNAGIILRYYSNCGRWRCLH